MSQETAKDAWWLASLGDTVVWARLRVLASGAAEVFDATGTTLHFVDEDAARAALLDAEFRALDGLDADDAAELGVSLAALTPPQAASDAELLPQMTTRPHLGAT